MAVVNEVIYVCGGYDGNDHLASVESFNTQTNHWTTLQHMVVPRCYVGACVLRGQLMVVAGSVLVEGTLVCVFLLVLSLESFTLSEKGRRSKLVSSLSCLYGKSVVRIV